MRLMKWSLIFALAIVAVVVALIVIGANRVHQPIAALPPEASTTTTGGVERLDLRFPCGETECAGWLYLAPGRAKSGAVIMGHGFAGTRDVGLPFFAERFAGEGLAVLVFDYRHFGSSGGAPRQLVDPWQQLDDWKSALAFIRAREDVDGSRVALWGTSLGAGAALVAATRDGNVRAVVAQAPQIDFGADGAATFPGYWWLTKLLASAWSDLAGRAFSDEASTIAAIAPSGGFGMICDDAAYAAFKSLVGPGTLYRNEVAASSIFTFDDYNPAIQATGLKAPILLIASRADRFAPFVAAEAFARAHPNARLEEIGGDHFDIYSAPHAERAADLATAFLTDHLAAVH